MSFQGAWGKGKWLLPCLLLALLLASGCPYNGMSKDRFMLHMSDGVALDTLVVHPEGDGPWPTLLYRTPYLELGGSSFADWVDKGYAVVAQNTRGRYASEGDDVAFAADGWGAPELGGHHDGLDTLNWIAGQSWCSGRIGTYGISAGGITQNLLASAGPTHLYGQWIDRAPVSLYDGAVFQGGAFRQEQMLGWLTLSGYSSASLDLFASHPYYDAVWDGLDMSPRQNLRNYPVVARSGWYDTFLQGTIDNFTSIRAEGGAIAQRDSKLILALCTHGTNTGAIAWPDGADGLPPGYTEERFQDRYIKGIKNGFDELPRVAYYLMGDLTRTGGPGNEWRYTDDWPVPATPVTFYFHNDGLLQTYAAPVDAAPIAYSYDPSNPVPTIGGANLLLPAGNYDQTIVESRDDVLLFDYGPLSDPIEVIGRIWVDLYAASDRVDTDFTAKLTDVYPDGRSVLLCDGILKGRCRNGTDSPEFMTPGTAYRFPIDLTSTAVVFDVGHTIRVAVSSSNSPRFAANPNTGAEMSAHDPVDPVVAVNTILMDELHPSGIVLPVIEAESGTVDR